MKIVITEGTGLTRNVVREQFSRYSELASSAIVFADEESALCLATSGAIDVLVTDINFSSMSSIDTLRMLLAERGILTLLLYADYDEFEKANSLLGAGAIACATKNSDVCRLAEKISSICRQNIHQKLNRNGNEKECLYRVHSSLEELNNRPQKHKSVFDLISAKLISWCAKEFARRRSQELHSINLNSQEISTLDAGKIHCHMARIQ